MSPRVMKALSAPMLSHLDPQFVEIMDDVRARLGRVFQAPEGSFAFAVSGTGTSAMETRLRIWLGRVRGYCRWSPATLPIASRRWQCDTAATSRV